MQRFNLFALVLLCCWLPACQTPPPPPSHANSGANSGVPAGDLFTEAAQASGLDFVHFNGMSGEFYFPEIVGAGGALFDYDNDGDPDVYLVQGALIRSGKTLKDATFKPQEPVQGRLYRNDLQVNVDGTRTLRFSDVTQTSGIAARGYGMGVATGDFDNDGWVDLYLTNFGSTQLWRNNGNGTFSEVTKPSGTAGTQWSVSAAFVDYDRDGWLDLFVGNYVNYSLATNRRCYSVTTRLDYCGPSVYPPATALLFHNRGDGTFENVTTKAQIGSAGGAALGVVCADFNEDGWMDIYVANDQRENFLWLNQRDGTFKNDAVLAGCAVSRDGKAEASMGVDAGDFDGDGDDDLFMTHLTDEKNTLYLNLGKGVFEDRSFETGLGTPSLPHTAFGTLMFDYDNNGWLDILVVNGAVTSIEAQAAQHDPYPFHQSNQLFRNNGNGGFSEITSAAGAVFKLSEVGRGAAFGDVDNDGDTDVLITNNNGRARLLLNQVGNRSPWLGLRLLSGQRDALGARVALLRPGQTALWRRVRADGSYASAHDPRVLFGLGAAGASGVVRVQWPDGKVEEWNNVPQGQYTTLRQGGGKLVQ